LLYSEIGKLKVQLDWLKKSLGSACDEPARVIDPSDTVAVVQQCVLAGVSRATVYAQQKPKPVDELDLLHSRLIDESTRGIRFTAPQDGRLSPDGRSYRQS